MGCIGGWQCRKCTPAAREAARLLARILDTASVEHDNEGRAFFVFPADMELGDRLAVWNSGDEDQEEDLPPEDGNDREGD